MSKCEYCGKDNPTESVQCSGCGTPLLSESEPDRPQKSKTIAVILALIFGPLGLLYLGMEGMMVVLLVLGVSIFVFPILLSAIHNTGFGLLISLLARVACVWWALKVVELRNTGDHDEPDAEILLNEAVKLEDVDFAKAITKYEEVIEKHPDSSASKVAKTCIQTLRSHKG